MTMRRAIWSPTAPAGDGFAARLLDLAQAARRLHPNIRSSTRARPHFGLQIRCRARAADRERHGSHGTVRARSHRLRLCDLRRGQAAGRVAVRRGSCARRRRIPDRHERKHAGQATSGAESGLRARSAAQRMRPRSSGRNWLDGCASRVDDTGSRARRCGAAIDPVQVEV